MLKFLHLFNLSNFYAMKNLLIVFLLFTSCQLLGKQKDTLSKYTSEQLAYKSSMATRHTEKPLLWKVYLDAMLIRNPSDSLQCETFYNLSWDLYRYTDYNLEVPIKMMKRAIYHGKKIHLYQTLLYCYDGLGAFYAMKNDTHNTLSCVKEIKRLNNIETRDELSKLKFNESRIYIWIGDFERATSLLLNSNKNIDAYVAKHPELSKEIRTGLVYDKKTNYIKLTQCYNFQKKLDSAAFYIKKIREIEKKGYPFHNNFDWLHEAFYLLLSKKYDAAIQYIAASEKKGYIDTKDKQYCSKYFLAVCWQQKKDHAKSLALCEEALNIPIKLASFINYELELCKLAASNAAAIGDSEKENFYSKKFNECSQNLNYTERSRFIAKLYQHDVFEVNKQLKSEKSRTAYAYYTLGVLALLSGYLCWQYIKFKRDRKKFETIIQSFEGRKEIGNSNFSETDNAKTVQRHAVTMSDGADEKIARQLANFEKKQKFLSPNVSLSNMAGDFNTNAAYLSSAIRKHKRANFNGYINELRIDYIILKLKTSPEYLNYKIAYLAEECGFSSHTVFIRVFTEKTGLTPSKFISFLKTEKEDFKNTDH